MGQKVSSKTKDMNFPEAALESYVRTEFRAMAKGKEGTLSRQQLLDLLILLGCSYAEKKLKELHVKSEASISEEDYVQAIMKDKALLRDTCRMRNWFNYFDDNNDGTATKAEMTKGLTDLDLDITDKELAKTVNDMDADKNGKITYEEFLRSQFAISLVQKK